MEWVERGHVVERGLGKVGPLIYYRSEAKAIRYRTIKLSLDAREFTKLKLNDHT